VSELRVQQVALSLAALAALAILVGLFSDVVAAVCLGIIALCAVITAPARRSEGGGWWNMFALGTVVSVAGALLAIPADTIGGLLAALGCVLVVVAAAMGFPAGAGE
jgi:hypothetical protein